jgi:hypothetical protein
MFCSGWSCLAGSAHASLCSLVVAFAGTGGRPGSPLGPDARPGGCAWNGVRSYAHASFRSCAATSHRELHQRASVRCEERSRTLGRSSRGRSSMASATLQLITRAPLHPCTCLAGVHTIRECLQVLELADQRPPARAAPSSRHSCCMPGAPSGCARSLVAPPIDHALGRVQTERHILGRLASPAQGTTASNTSPSAQQDQRYPPI